MTRATRQLWEEREKFLKFDRGWDPTHDDDVDDLDLDSLGVGEDDEVDEEKLLAKIEARTAKTEGPEIDYGKDPENLDRKIKGRLEAVESLYVSNQWMILLCNYHLTVDFRILPYPSSSRSSSS